MAFDDVSEVVRRRMAKVRKTESKPEVTVRKLAHRMGYRFRKNRRDLPGTPDVVFPARKKIILVHGCFWHQHPDCKLAKRPTVRTHYWIPKLSRNIERDITVSQALRDAGWEVLVIWECETHSEESVRTKIKHFLGPLNSATSQTCD